MKGRMLIVGGGLGLIVWALILAPWWVPAATGAPSVQAQSDAVAAWMSTTLRADVPSRPVEVIDAQANSGEATADGRITLAPRLTPVRRLYTLAHEHAHAPRNSACWWEADGSTRTEEGLADALVRDLWPALARRFLGRGVFWATVPEYDDEVAGVRYAVRKLTGGRGWGRPERLQLRVLWGASCEGRTDLLARAAAR